MGMASTIFGPKAHNMYKDGQTYTTRHLAIGQFGIASTTKM